MGHWGYGWTQNDDAQDLLCKVIAPAKKAIRQALKQKSTGRIRWYEAARASVQIMLDFPRGVLSVDDLKDCVSVLERISTDTEAHSIWDSPETYAMTVRAELSRAQTVLLDYQRDHL